MCTVFVLLVQCSGRASTGNVPTYQRLYSYCTFTVAQCVLCLYLLYSDSAWPARAMYVCTVLVPLVQWSGMASTANIHLARFFVLVLCVYYCTVCTVRVPLVQWFNVASTGRIHIGPCFNSYCGCTIAQCVLCLCLMYSGLALPARVMYI